MKICVSCKEYFKESKDVQRAIISGIHTLYARIKSYEDQNIPFDLIFNDDSVKYDKHGQLYTYKFSRGRLQIRLLYAYLIIDGEPIVLVADFFIKKKNNKAYINSFSGMADADPAELYKRSSVIEAA